MAQRNLTEQDIRAVLRHHHTSVPGAQPTTIRYRGRVRGRDLSVVAELPGVTADPVKVITIY
jgi:hypothetical protein